MRTKPPTPVPSEWFESFRKWTETRGVWPRVTHEEIFLAGWNARNKEVSELSKALNGALLALKVRIPGKESPDSALAIWKKILSKHL